MKILDKEKLSKSIEEIANYDLENNNIFGSSYCDCKVVTLFIKSILVTAMPKV